MKTLYLDCGMGAAGDMLTAALLELLPDAEGFMAQLNALEIPGVTMQKEKVSKCGIGGTHITVKVHGMGEDESMHEHAEEHSHVSGHEHHNHHHDSDNEQHY